MIYYGDCLDVMQDMESDSVDLIYLDPPYNSGRDYGEFDDRWDSMESYIEFMRVRVVEMYRLLKTTGSFYLHCDPSASHYLKVMLDTIFSIKNFRNEIVWCYRGGGVPKNDFARRHDILLRYSKSNQVTFNVDAVRLPYSDESNQRLKYTARSFRDSGIYENYRPNEKGKHPEDWWEMQPLMPSDKERLGYSTQKPQRLLERIIKASTNEGDIVLDPFLGSGTTYKVAEKLKRKAIGIEILEQYKHLHQPPPQLKLL